MKQVLFVFVFVLVCFVNAQNFIVGNGYYLLNQFRVSGFNGDGLSGPATATNLVLGFEKHPSGDIYFPEFFNCRVRKLSATDNKVSTVIGNGNCITSGNGGPGTAARTAGPIDVVLDALDSNTLFFAELTSNSIRKYDVQTGIVTHFAGGEFGCSANTNGDGGPATSARFCNIVTLTFDRNGNLFVVDFSSRRIRKIDRITNIITTIMGTGLPQFNGDGPAFSRNINNPTGVAINPITGDIFVSSFDQLIQKIDASGFATTFAGVLNVASFSGENVPVSGSPLTTPGRMAFDAQGNLFFWESLFSAGRVRKMDAATSTASTVAGIGTVFSVNNISALQMAFRIDSNIGKVVCEADGNILVSEFFSMVRVIGVAAPENQCGNGIVESGEDCDSANPCCDTNCKFQPSSQVCRAAAGPCDLSEFCSGTSELCPSDVLAPTSSLCGQSFGVCEVGIPTSCTGTDPACPTVPSILQLPAVGNDSAVNMQWSSFSVVSFSNVNGNTGRLQGRVAAKNDISFGNGFSVADGLNGVVDGEEPYSLVSGRNLNWGSGALFPNPIPFPIVIPGNVNGEENGFVGETETVASFLEDQILSQGCGANLGCLNGDFNSYQTYLANTVQPYLASLTQNVNAFVEFSGLMIECNDNSSPLYVLNTDAATIAGVTWYSIRGCNGLASWVINVKDESSSVTFAGDNLPTISEQTVFNILGSGRTINVQTIVNGNILSPRNTLSQTGGTINGRVYVANVASVLDVALVRCSSFKTVIVTDFLAIQANVGSTTITVVSGGNIFVGDLVTIGTQALTVVAKTNNADGSATLTLSGAVTATASAFSAVKFEFLPAVTGSRFDASKSLLVVADSGSAVFASLMLISSVVVALLF